MDLKPGQRLRSQVCSTEVIVVRPPSTETELTCGGQPMVPITTEIGASDQPAAGLDTGSQLGKRYTTEEGDTLEVLVTKAGQGTLAAGHTPLALKDAQPLPSSD